MILDGHHNRAHRADRGQRAAAGVGGGQGDVEPQQHARHAAAVRHQVQHHRHDEAQRCQAHCAHEAHDLRVEGLGVLVVKQQSLRQWVEEAAAMECSGEWLSCELGHMRWPAARPSTGSAQSTCL